MTYSAGPSRFTTEEENLQLARQAQAEYEAQQQQQGGNNFIDSLGKAALVAGVGTLAALGGRRLLANRAARNATQQVRVEDLGDIGRKAETDVRRAAASTYAAPAPSQPPPSQPTPGGMIDRLGKMAEDTRQARSERMPGVIQTDLSEVSPERARAALGIINNRVLNPRNSTAEEGVQSFFRESPAYGQLPEVVQQVASEAKALPPARTTGTDFLTSQLGSRGYIEQTVLDRAAEQAAGDLIDEVNAFSNKAARSELAKQGASVQSQQRKNLWSLVNEIQNETLVDEQQATRAFNVDQAINALDAAEDQQTGRVKQQLQRNEDVDLSKIELQEDMAEASRQAMINETSPSQMIGYEADAAINQVASQLPDGLPVDQAEQTAGAFAKKQIMQTRMNQMRAQLAEEGYRGLGLEKELASRTNVKQAAELYAATGDPNVLELASTTPSLPLAVKPKSNVQLGQSKTSFVDEEIPTSAYYEPFKQRQSESGNLIQADIYYTNKLSNLTAKLEGAPEFIDNPEYTNFIEQTNMAMSAMRQGDDTAARIFSRNKALLNEGKAPVAKIQNPEHQALQRQLGYAEQSRSDVRAKQEALELEANRFPMLQKVVTTGEGTRVFGEVDPSTGQLIAETLEVRPGRPSLPGGISTSTATGRAIRGRVGAEGTVAGPIPGIFEPAPIVTESSFKPESARYRGETARGSYEVADAGKGLQYEAQPVRWDPNLHLPEERTPEGFVYSEEAMVKPSQPLGRESNLGRIKSLMRIAKPSVDVSSKLRQLQQTGRLGEADDFLTRFKQGLI